MVLFLLKVQLEVLEHQEVKVNKAKLDSVALLVQLERLDWQDRPDRREQLATQVQLGLLGNQEQQVQQDHLVVRESVEQLDILVFLELLVTPVGS